MNMSVADFAFTYNNNNNMFSYIDKCNQIKYNSDVKAINTISIPAENISDKISAMQKEIDNLKIKDKKEGQKKTMKLLNCEFGSCKDNDIRMSPYGLAVKSNSTNKSYVAYNKEKNSIMSVDGFTFGDGKFFYKIPVAIKDIKVGDLIIHMSKPMYVCEINDKTLICIDIATAEKKEILPCKNVFNFDYYTKIISLFQFFQNGADVAPSADSPFGGNMLWMLMLNDGDSTDNMWPLLMMNGDNSNMNMMLMYMMMKDKKS